MGTILGCTKDTSAEAMRYLLGFPTMDERHKLAQVKAFLRVMADKTYPLHSNVDQRPPSRLKRGGSEWMTEATGTIDNSLSVESIPKGAPWIVFDDYHSHYTKVIVTLGLELREWGH